MILVQGGRSSGKTFFTKIAQLLTDVTKDKRIPVDIREEYETRINSIMEVAYANKDSKGYQQE